LPYRSPASSRSLSPARAVAAEVLARVFADDAFATPALDASLHREALDPRDAGLATELVYGVLRTEAFLDDRLASLAGRAGYARDPRVRAHLLMAAYSVLFLDRVPAFAAVSEAVEGVRATGDERASGFANAVLRKLADEAAATGARPALEDAIAASAPGWLRGSLRRSLGRAGASAYLAAGPVPPPLGLALSAGEERKAWITMLSGSAPGASIAAGPISPRAILARGAGDLRRLPGAGAAWIAMEEGAQVVALAAGARPGDRVLDACAGHGNKTWLVADEVAPGGSVDAADLHAPKLAELLRSPAGARVRATFEVDWTTGSGDVPDDYDLVIVDAPCSGIGTLRRRPEIARRRAPEDLPRLAALQTAIARRAATRAKDGGRLLFAVCSVLREEAEEIVAALSASEDLGVRLEPAPFTSPAARAVAGDATSLRLLPHLHGTDGYFAASFLVRRVARS
jgi:16S rRNA (cytosine967-C5)-methyltransferase